MRSSRNVTISVRVPLDMARKAKRRAKKEKVSLSAVFLQAYSHYEGCSDPEGSDLALVEAAIAEVRDNPMTPEEIEKEERDLDRTLEARFRDSSWTEDDAVRIIHEYRASRRAT